jgi:hypothetical protein
MFIMNIQVKHQMLLLSKSNNKGNGHPDYTWLCQKPRLTAGQSRKLEELIAKVIYKRKR